jgi:hypothetical protein
MMSRLNLRTGLAVFILVIFSFYQLFQSINYYNPSILMYKLGVYGKLPPDPVTEYTARFDCLKADLSPLETIGFITNTPGEAFPTENYLMTQYAIAPVLLKDSIDANTVIGYYPGGADRDLLYQHQLTIVKSCKQGVFLAKKKAK